MWKEKYTAEQIALVLTQATLGLEYFMQEEFCLYDVGPSCAPPRSPEWLSHCEDDWFQKRIYELGMGCWEQEFFGDQLFLEDFRPVLKRVASSSGPRRGKVAFLALTTALILKNFAEYVSGVGRQRADDLRAEINKYLRGTWSVDLDRGIVNPELALHLTHAREAARKWRKRLELLTREPLRAPFSESQIASLRAYQAAFQGDPWFLCLVKGCGRRALYVDRDGLHCPKCADQRDWAWSWMADWSLQRHCDEDQG